MEQSSDIAGLFHYYAYSIKYNCVYLTLVTCTCDIVWSEQVDLQVGGLAMVCIAMRGRWREFPVLIRFRAPALQVTVRVTKVETPCGGWMSRLL